MKLLNYCQSILDYQKLLTKFFYDKMATYIFNFDSPFKRLSIVQKTIEFQTIVRVILDYQKTTYKVLV